MTIGIDSLPLKRSLGLALLAFIVAGCAQTSEPGYYNPPPASTTQDAIQFAEGGVTQRMVHAPSQIQIKLRPDQPPQARGTTPSEASSDGLTEAGQAQLERDIQADASSRSALISRAQTFFGTLPCFHQDMVCTAQQVTLTIAPNGRWRARVQYLDQQQASGQSMSEQGCWRSLATQPPRLLLMDGDLNVRAEFAMTASDVLRLRSIDGEVPNLTYTLNRQPDLDPISELDGQPQPNCP
jgi:hypothetical protein